MSTEPTDTTHAMGADDRSDDVPQGGFAPIVDLPESPSVATMPLRPPATAGAWSAAAVDSDVEEASHESSGHAPPAAFPASPAPPAEPSEPADESASTEASVERFKPVEPVQPVEHVKPIEPVEQPTAASGDEADSHDPSDDGVVFFGDGAAPTPPSGWVTDDDADLVLPIEPARLVSAQPFASQELAANEPDPAPAPPVTAAFDSVVEPDDPTRPVDVEAVCSLFASRLSRALGPTIESAERFLTDDDASEIVLPSLTGSIVCGAGSELRGVVVDDESDLFGVSLEIGAPHNVSLGVRFPVQLVRSGGTTTVDDVGGVIVIAVSGGLEATARFDDAVDADVAAALTRDAGRFFDEVDRRREDAGVTVTKLSVDSVGTVRIEVERA